MYYGSSFFCATNFPYAAAQVRACCTRKGGMNMPQKRPREMTNALKQAARQRSETDVLGSYTGVPWEEEEAPVQDADDL